jgi:O-succinylbenzoate synthase
VYAPVFYTPTFVFLRTNFCGTLGTIFNHSIQQEQHAVSVIEKIVLHPIAMQLVESLQTSGWNDSFRPAVIVEIHSDGQIGWGESVAGWSPGYCYETIGTTLHLLEDYLIPALVGQSIEQAAIVPKFRGHPLAKSALDMALYDLRGKLAGQSISADGVEGRRKRVEVGVSIGIHDTIDETIGIIDKRVKEGYTRVKLKIKPGWDVELLREVRRQYPHIRLMADANSAYTLDQLPVLKQIDELGLIMIEQPLGYEDIYQHSKLQPHLQTPICLDESIHTVDDARLAVELGAARIINLKVSRVGGLTNARKVHDFCYGAGVPLWIGGMLETGIGRAANLHIASLPGVTLPSDISATNRYYDPDITEPFILNSEDSTITVPTGAGLGVTVDRDQLATFERAFADFPKTAFMAPAHD